MRLRVPHPSRRTLLYVLVALQFAFLGGIVAIHELNRALDWGPGVQLEIPEANAGNDPFRGPAVRGHPALNLDAAHVPVPAGLAPGDAVLVFFAPEAGKRPRVVQVQRRRWGADPLFGPDLFSIPGRVVAPAGGPGQQTGRQITLSAGTPPVSVALDFPDAIPVADAALDALTTPTPILGTLRRGAFGHRFLTDLYATGQTFPSQMALAYDPARDRLAIAAGRVERVERRHSPEERPAASSLFLFDGSGSEVASAEIPGHVFEIVHNPRDGTFLAMLSPQRYFAGPVQLVQLRDDGTIVRRSPQIHSDRILGFDRDAGEAWALIGTTMASPQPPFILQRFGLDGFVGPRIGPIASRPRSILVAERSLWIVETEEHRVSRYDASGALRREYRDLNKPTEIAVDGGSLLVVEADQTQLARFAADGSVLWRTPRFRGLAWVLPEPRTGEGWVAAARYENSPSGVFRYGADGHVARLPLTLTPRTSYDWMRCRLAGDVIGDLARGRLYVRENQAVAIVGTDGGLIRRVDTFRFATPRPLPQ
jgi:hypothetical protein